RVRFRRLLSGAHAAPPAGSARTADLDRLAHAARIGRGVRGGRLRLAHRSPSLPEHRIMSVIIEARGLRKAFTVTEKAGRFRRTRRTVPAVDGIDLAVDRGEM